LLHAAYPCDRARAKAPRIVRTATIAGLFYVLKR
jgi:hypothetical protein